ncbi:hypothetical protein [Streptomyces sp. NPDC088731]
MQPVPVSAESELLSTAVHPASIALALLRNTWAVKPCGQLTTRRWDCAQ